MASFEELRSINVNDHTETKSGLTYLSWAWAWDMFKQKCPDATYELVKNANGLPYFESNAGVMVYTKVTVENITYEMWLPVMDGANKAMLSTPYNYKTKYGEKSVEAFSMFDVNKTIMRCLVKNLAMFGFAIYIYAGEDLPDVNNGNQAIQPTSPVESYVEKLTSCVSLAELQAAYILIAPIFKADPKSFAIINKAKDIMKTKLTSNLKAE
jgi:hypothetical protein